MHEDMSQPKDERLRRRRKRPGAFIAGLGFVIMAAAALAMGASSAGAETAQVSVVDPGAAHAQVLCGNGSRLPRPSFQTQATISGNTISVTLVGVLCATEYHYRITEPNGDYVYGAARTSAISHAISGMSGRYCIQVLAVGGGHLDSFRHNRDGSDSRGCATKGVASNCPSRLSTPVFKTGSTQRARWVGNNFSASWSSNSCADEFHYHLTGPANFSEYGATRGASTSVYVPPSRPAGRYCLSVVAVNGGRQRDSFRANANGLNQYGCVNRAGSTARLATPNVRIETSNSFQIKFDWQDVTEAAEYHWTVTWPDGQILRGTSSRFGSHAFIRLDRGDGGPVCIQVRAVLVGRDSNLSSSVCDQSTDDPDCALSEAITPASMVQQLMRGYDLDLYYTEESANNFPGNTNASNHIVVQSIFDPVVRDKQLIVDEYSFVARVGWNLNSHAELQAFMTRLATDMDNELNGRFQSQGNFKLQAYAPAPGVIIDIDADGETLFDSAAINAPVFITHIESQCFGVRTIEYNDEQHILHGDRRWGYDVLDLEGGVVKFYTRGVSVPDRFYLAAQRGEKAFWSEWVKEMKNEVTAGGGAIIGGTEKIDQRKSYTAKDLFYASLSWSQRRQVRDSQVLSHSREVHRLNEEINRANQRGASYQVIQSLTNKKGIHEREARDWQAVSLNG